MQYTKKPVTIPNDKEACTMNDTPRGSRLQRDTRSTELQPVDTNNRRRRKRRKNGKALYYAVLIVLLGVLVFSSVKIITYLKDQKNA